MLTETQLSNGDVITYVSPLIAQYNSMNRDHGPVIDEPGYYVVGEDIPYATMEEAIESLGLCPEEELASSEA